MFIQELIYSFKQTKINNRLLFFSVCLIAMSFIFCQAYKTVFKTLEQNFQMIFKFLYKTISRHFGNKVSRCSCSIIKTRTFLIKQTLFEINSVCRFSLKKNFYNIIKSLQNTGYTVLIFSKKLTTKIVHKHLNRQLK